MAHCSLPGTSAHEMKVIEIVVPRIDDVEQVRLAMAKARGSKQDWKARKLEPLPLTHLNHCHPTAV